MAWTPTGSRLVFGELVCVRNGDVRIPIHVAFDAPLGARRRGNPSLLNFSLPLLDGNGESEKVIGVGPVASLLTGVELDVVVVPLLPLVGGGFAPPSLGRVEDVSNTLAELVGGSIAVGAEFGLTFKEPGVEVSRVDCPAEFMAVGVDMSVGPLPFPIAVGEFELEAGIEFPLLPALFSADAPPVSRRLLAVGGKLSAALLVSPNFTAVEETPSVLDTPFGCFVSMSEGVDCTLLLAVATFIEVVVVVDCSSIELGVEFSGAGAPVPLIGVGVEIAVGPSLFPTGFPESEIVFSALFGPVVLAPPVSRRSLGVGTDGASAAAAVFCWLEAGRVDGTGAVVN